jgi:multiple sugar transport system substrate-binding protein
MKKRTIGVLALSATVMLAGCSGTPDADPASSGSPDGAVTGTVNLLGPEDPATFEPVIAAFESANPGTSVEYTQVPFDQLNSTLEQRLAAEDESIDVYTVDQPRVAQLAAKGFLEDLSDLQDEARAATSDAQYNVNVFRDQLWALPIWNSTQLMFVNNDALAAAGIPGPASDPVERWTWEETVEAAKQAQAAGTTWGLLLEQTEYYYQLQPLMESLDGGSGITGDDMLTPAVTTEGWQEAMTWYHSLFEEGLSPRGVGSFETSPLFNQGDVAFFVGGPWDVGAFAESTVNWSVAPMPYFEGGEQVTPTGSWSWGINPASQNKAAARAFLEFAALDPAGNLATTETQTIIPANSEAREQYLPTLEALAGDKSAGVAQLITHEVDDTAVARPTSVGYVQFEEVMNKAFGDIRNGSDPTERLDQAAGQLENAWKALQ